MIANMSTNKEIDEQFTNLTLDAVAEQPRKHIQQLNASIHLSDDESKDKEESRNGKEETYVKPSYKHSKPKTNPKPKTKSKTDPSCSNTKIVGNVINVSNSSNVHVGPYVVYPNSCGTESKPKKPEKKASIEITKEILQTFQNPNKLKTNELDIISTHIGQDWRTLGRKLKYSEGQLEQFYLNFIDMRIKEVIYQMLLDWTRMNPKQATIGNLSSILWGCDMQEVVSRLTTALNNPDDI